MSRAKKYIFVALIIIILMGIFPPAQYLYIFSDSGGIRNTEYEFILTFTHDRRLQINLPLLIVQWVLVGASAAALYLIKESRQK